MAMTSLKIVAGNLQARIESVAKDAREASAKAQGLGKGVQGTEEVKMAAQIITKACTEANKYLEKAYRGR